MPQNFERDLSDGLALSRRHFLKLAAIAGSTLPMGLASGAAATGSAEIRNDLLRLVFNTSTGHFDLLRASGKPLLLKGRAEFMTPTGVSRSTDDSFVRTVEVRTTGKAAGDQLVAHCKSTDGLVNLELRFTLLQGVEAITVELVCENSSPKPLLVPEIRPLQVDAAEGGGCFWPGTTKVLTNGQMYSDAGQVKDFPRSKATTSWWNAAFYRGDEEECLVCGYLENKSSRGQLSFQAPPDRTTPEGPFSLTARSEFQAGFELQPGAKVSSDPFVLHVGRTPYLALEWYAGTIARLHQVRLNPAVNGWCSWFSFFGDITQAEVLRAAEFAAKHLKPFGFEYVQVDDGFYRGFGDWEGNAKFPQGMKWLADQIRALGLKPGIW
ncbi:MAG TPA: twin-arginine translocation signal domain-containing protein, partial [Clostridia bacterium]|nr:twin-arginine translocation signal domain-containing protein [Clostridia bacterium]